MVSTDFIDFRLSVERSVLNSRWIRVDFRNNGGIDSRFAGLNFS